MWMDVFLFRILPECSLHVKVIGGSKVNNEAKERSKKVARSILEKTYAHALDGLSSEEEFQESVNELVDHLNGVRRRSRVVTLEAQVA